LLRNPIYSGGFQYIPYDLPKIAVPGHPGKKKELDRAKVNLDGDTNTENNEAQSDLVRIALFLPYYSVEI
jgi:hypothetical protein